MRVLAVLIHELKFRAQHPYLKKIIRNQRQEDGWGSLATRLAPDAVRDLL